MKRRVHAINPISNISALMGTTPDELRAIKPAPRVIQLVIGVFDDSLSTQSNGVETGIRRHGPTLFRIMQQPTRRTKRLFAYLPVSNGYHRHQGGARGFMPVENVPTIDDLYTIVGNGSHFAHTFDAAFKLATAKVKQLQVLGCTVEVVILSLADGDDNGLTAPEVAQASLRELEATGVKLTIDIYGLSAKSDEVAEMTSTFTAMGLIEHVTFAEPTEEVMAHIFAEAFTKSVMGDDDAVAEAVARATVGRTQGGGSPSVAAREPIEHTIVGPGASAPADATAFAPPLGVDHPAPVDGKTMLVVDLGGGRGLAGTPEEDDDAPLIEPEPESKSPPSH